MKKSLLFIFCLFCLAVYAQIDLTSNLKVCMPFTGNANDLSGNSLNGTVSSATLTTDRFGVANRAYQFDKDNNSFISISSFSAIAPTNELTISMWAKSDITTSNCLFILNPDNPNDRCVGCAQYLNAQNTMIVWDYGNILTSGRLVVFSIPIDITNWHHYTYVMSESGNTKSIYLDGVVIASVGYGMTVSNKNKPFYIGGGFSGGNPGKIMWTGKIDDVCIYNRALTPAEITALYIATGICSTGTNTSVPDAMEEPERVENLVVHPTISEGIFAIINHDQDILKIEVFNMAGRLIKSIPSKESGGFIDLTTYDRGIYLLKVTGRKKSFTQKIIRN